MVKLNFVDEKALAPTINRRWFQNQFLEEFQGILLLLSGSVSKNSKPKMSEFNILANRSKGVQWL